MPDPLRISLVQSPLHWENISANQAYFQEQLERLAGRTDLIILPEMFTTGFTMSPVDLAEPLHGPTTKWMQQMAQKTGAACTGSFIATEAGRYYNRLLFVYPDGSLDHYDKKHLFTLAGEHEHYTPGSRRLEIAYRGWKICPLICYDLRFPVWSRNTNDYDLLLYVANWPDKRREAWMALLAARAIENQAYCVGVNRVGTDEKGHVYSGDSSIYDYSGRLLARLTDQEAVVTLSLEYGPQQAFRQKLNFLADRDDFSFA